MKNKMHEIIESLRPQIEAVPWSEEFYYAQWLAQAHAIARNSTSFLGLIMIHAQDLREFHRRCTEHIAEETGHERLIENDLKRLGHPLYPELPVTSAIYQPQYYRIVAQHPLSFVGYVLFLELLAPAYAPYIMERAKKDALSFLKVHAVADEDHTEQAFKIFDQMPKELADHAMSNFEMAAACYRPMLEQIAAMRISLKKAA